MLNLIKPVMPGPRSRWLAAGAVLWIAPALPAQTALTHRIAAVLDRAPFDRGSWGVMIEDQRGQVVFERNADQLFVPASTAKLAVTTAALALLSPTYRMSTSVYASGPVADGVLQGDLIAYGRGDPGFGAHCYGPDTTAVGICDSVWTRMDALADSLAARGILRVTGGIVGDGSYFEPLTVHPEWEAYDLNWWYAAPVSGLGFNDNSVNVTWRPGPRPGSPAAISFEPDLHNFEFENRARTGPRGSRRTIDFFRRPGTMFIWAEGIVPFGHPGKTEYFALPDPNLYFAQALRAALERRGVSIAGPSRGTTDSLAYAAARATAPLVTVSSRPLGELVYPLINDSHNWFAEMLLKTLGRVVQGAGSWEAGLETVGEFLVDSVGVESTAFRLHDGSGLARGNLITPRAMVRLLAYARTRPALAALQRALPTPGIGTLKDRLVCTPLEGQIAAKTGSLGQVYSIAGYVRQADGDVYVFDFVTNHQPVGYTRAVSQMDALLLALAPPDAALSDEVAARCTAAGR